MMKVEQNEKELQKVYLIKQLIKKGNITQCDVEWLRNRVYNNRWMQLEMISMFDDIKNNSELSPSMKMKLLDTYTNVYKTIHGTKLEVENNVNITVNQYKDLISKNDEVIIDAELADRSDM